MVSNRVKTIVGIAGVVFLSKLFGLVREMVIAEQFGTSADYDLYLIAIILPALAYGVINFASFYLFVPYLTRKFEKLSSGEQSDGWKTAWGLFNFSFITALVLTFVIILSAPYLMKIWAGEYNPEQFALIVFYSRVTAVMVLLGTTEAFLRAILNVKGIFVYPAAGQIIFNLFSIVSIILLAGRLSVGAIALGLLVGLFIQNVYLVLRLVAARFFLNYTISFARIEVKELLVTGSVLILIELLNRSYFMIDRYFAPEFGDGVVAALNYGQVLVQLPDAVVGFAIASVLFPLFSRNNDTNNWEEFNSLYRDAIVSGMLIAVPLTVLFFINAREIIYLLFYRGVFDGDSLEKTALILKPYTPTIIALFIISTSVRACYGRSWFKAVLYFTVLLLGVKFLSTALLPRWFGYPGISMATSISEVSFAVLLLLLIVNRSRMNHKSKFFFRLLKIIFAGSIGLVLMYFGNNLINGYFTELSHFNSLARIGFSIAVIIVFYGGFIYIFGFGDYIKRLFRRQASKQ